MNDRTRTFSWNDPMDTFRAVHGHSGEDFLQGIADGTVPAPPIAHLLGMTLESVSKGEACFGLDPAEYHYNPIGTVHGGVISTILDSALGVAVHSTLPEGKAYTSVELKVNFVRPVTVKTGRVRAHGHLIHAGSRIATAEARLTDDAGKLYAHATTTCLIFDAAG